MLSEEKARELLGLAAATIEVGPGDDLAIRSRRPRRVAAAAATAATIAASLALGFVVHDHDHRNPERPAVLLPSPDELPDSPRHYEVDRDRMPLLVGWKVGQAKAELRRRGVTVAVRHDVDYGCQPLDRVMRTEPTVAAPLAPGDRVVIVLPPQHVIDCVGSGAPWDWAQSWNLVDFAEGRGPAPAFADHVTLWLGNRFSRTITAQQAKDPANWVVCSDNGVVCASALHDLVEQKYFQLNESPVQPILRIQNGKGSRMDSVIPTAGHDKGAVLPTRDALAISWEAPMDGAWSGPTVDVFRSGDPRGAKVAIDAVATWTGLNADGSAGVPVPDVVGAFGPEAGEKIQNADLHPIAERVTDCTGPTGRVLSTNPAAGDLARPGADVAVRLCRRDNLEPDDHGIAQRFVALALGSRADTRGLFADRVTLYLGNRKVTTITGEQAASDRPAYDVCPAGGGYAEATCPFSALEAIRQSTTEPIFTRDHPVLGACAAGDHHATLPPRQFVTIGIAEPDACMNNWDVEIYHDDRGRITDVNLLLGAP